MKKRSPPVSRLPGDRAMSGGVGWLPALALSLLAQGCAAPAPPPQAATLAPPVIGYSGMTPLDATTYLVVHDFKSAGPRLGLLRVAGPGSPRYEPLDAGDWPSPDRRATDLEAVCALPGGGFLAAESGPSAGRAGRMFHFELRDHAPQWRRTLSLPAGVPHPHNFEGLACAPRRDGTVLLLLGERGGSASYPQGRLYWGVFDPAAGTVFWPPAGQVGVAVNPPGRWLNPREKRAIADLYLAADGALWAVASEDGGDQGPFRSVIYRAATVRPERDPPVAIAPKPRTAWRLDGLKVEALAGPAAIPGSVLSVATDDEQYGGIWRPLYRALPEGDREQAALPAAQRPAGKGR